MHEKDREVIEYVVDMSCDLEKKDHSWVYHLVCLFPLPPCLERSLTILRGMRTLVIKDKNEK